MKMQHYFLRISFYLLILVGGCGPVGTKSRTPKSGAVPPITLSTNTPDSLSKLQICSFNIKFLGFYKKKDHAALADLLKGYDIILIQELVSPPVDGIFPDGSPYEADEESKTFVDLMTQIGFSYLLSLEDTGTNEVIHLNSSATEWFIAFYKPQVVDTAGYLTTGFLAEDRSNHPSYERVPHAFSFRTRDQGLDFTLISVHLQPGSGSADKSRRKEELMAITQWIDLHDEIEKDYIIVGDMNIEDQDELISVLPVGYQSLNAACLPTNLAQNGKPYDQVMYNIDHTGPDLLPALEIIDLMEVMRPYWQGPDPYPESDLNLYYQVYSDHKPVVFTMVSDGVDDD